MIWLSVRHVSFPCQYMFVLHFPAGCQDWKDRFFCDSMWFLSVRNVSPTMTCYQNHGRILTAQWNSFTLPNLWSYRIPRTVGSSGNGSAGGTVQQDDCWPIDILDECPVNFKPINFDMICAIYSSLVWLYFNEDKLPKMIGNSDWYIRIYPPDICPPRNLVDDHGCLPHWPLFIQSSLSRSLVKAEVVAAVEWKLFFW